MRLPSLGCALVLCALALPVHAAEIGYVVASESPHGYALWSSWAAFETCVQTLTRRPTPDDLRIFCEDGVSGGIKPKVGRLAAGTMVERLASRECKEMVEARVLDGPYKGATGCIARRALTSRKPE